ncbi:choice-of-anchor B family protein [Marivirga arenosa]|uniref:Choice-of-anchor B family protein n=1 Tax=Marivirga arenosa TaxID=3059076 RepID=A0AA51ZXK6_9BACT|nr:choice-of-anchor B family protein [Marivirga sp. BKB1-2]WNB18572.1 choice-of-anchor B family protein [Marivirga sp. BKB1-2]
MIKCLLSAIAFLIITINSFGQTPCENGSAGGYACNQIDLLANISNEELSASSGIESNDIWGWTDPETAKEYVLMGQVNGVVFVDISDPIEPIIVGRLASHTGNSSSWRDIKVYKDHAFVVADNNAGHGMQVFDLTRLRDTKNLPKVFDEDAHYDGVSSAHNVVINELTGFAYIVGARNASNNCGQGGLHIVDIRDPKDPKFAGCFDADRYTHDAQCVIYQGPDVDYQGKEICFNANENTITIANVENKQETKLLAKQGYPESSYSHQAWLTEDHQYLISNDELDETNRGIRTRTLIWDVKDLDNPKLITQYFSERMAIDHNLYIKDNMVYQSNYTNGLIILDSKRVADGELREMAYFDTFPQSENTSFNGSWSNYPYFESGFVAVSDINNGLFIVQPNFSDIFTQHPFFTSCGSNPSLIVEISVASSEVDKFQWQALTSEGFIDLIEDDNYNGVNTQQLTINPQLEGLNEIKFRCKISLTNGSEYVSYLSNYYDGMPKAIFATELNDLIVSFDNNSIAANSYEWDFGDGSEISNEVSPIHTYSEAKTYEVILTATNSCGTSQYVYDLNLSNCLPFTDFIVSVEEEEISFINISTNADAYEWDFGDGSNISNEANPVYKYDSEGPYEVTLTAFNDCGTKSTTMIIDASILSNQNELNEKLNIFPNPVIDVLNVEFNSKSTIQEYRIISSTGKTMYKKNQLETLSIPVSNWPTGIYFFVITTKSGEYSVKKIVKQ